MKKYLLLFALAISSLTARAQFIQAELVASGLTCSMCSFATQKQLQTVPYIDSIGTDLDHTTFILFFKRDMPMDLNLLKARVEDAGFSVASLVLTYRFDNQKVDNNYHLVYRENLFHFLDAKTQTLNGNQKLKMVDKGFLSDKQFKKYKKTAVEHAHPEADKATEAIRVYHVVLL